MKLYKKKIFFFLFFICLFYSCEDDNEYRVDSEFLPYLTRFEIEAGKRGKNFNFQRDGIIIEFAKLKESTAGLTYKEHPVRIQIDKKYWEDISSSAGADIMKENLLFHELGHGILGRKHLNTVLENGDWKSIMCGGEKIDNRSWNINYRGFRRNYYIDELFDESTTPPFLLTSIFNIDTLAYSLVIEKNFDDAQHAGWTIKNTTTYETSIDNRRLKFQSKIDSLYFVFAKTNVNIQSDFKYKLTLECQNCQSKDQYGIIFGTLPDSFSPQGKKSIEYFTIDQEQQMFMGNSNWYSFYTQLFKPEIQINGQNKLEIVKSGQILYYFINERYTYCSEIEASEDSFYFGFIVPPKGTMLVDNFLIYEKTPRDVSAAKIKGTTIPEFKVLSCPVENFRPDMKK